MSNRVILTLSVIAMFDCVGTGKGIVSLSGDLLPGGFWLSSVAHLKMNVLFSSAGNQTQNLIQASTLPTELNPSSKTNCKNSFLQCGFMQCGSMSVVPFDVQ